MITFLNLGRLGRLGNQLFQYAALKGLSIKNNYEMKIPDPNRMSWHGQNCLLDKFNIECEYLNQEDYNNIKYSYVEPDWKKYDPNFYNLPDNISIEGFFQSIFYFEDVQEILKKELIPKYQYFKQGKDYIDNLRKEFNCEIVSVHVRRGDNMENGQTGLIKAYDLGGIYEKYFQNAKKIFEGKKIKYLVFTGGKRNDEDNKDDIEWCKKFFDNEDFIFSENQQQLIDYSRIMNCDHNILSHASSFGWWAAYVNPNPNKIIVAPEFYHPDELELKREKFYPKEYILK